jgi:hypothetical protein
LLALAVLPLAFFAVTTHWKAVAGNCWPASIVIFWLVAAVLIGAPNGCPPLRNW